MEKREAYLVEQKKTKLAVVIAWCFNALLWCALFVLAIYFQQQLWIVFLYSVNAILGVFTAVMHILQYAEERKL